MNKRKRVWSRNYAGVWFRGRWRALPRHAGWDLAWWPRAFGVQRSLLVIGSYRTLRDLKAAVAALEERQR